MDAALADALAAVLSYIFQFIQIIVIASIIVSWVGDQSNTIVQMIYSISEPIYRPIRKYTSRLPGPFDWAPIVVIMVIIFLEKFLVASLRNYGQT